MAVNASLVSLSSISTPSVRNLIGTTSNRSTISYYIAIEIGLCRSLKGDYQFLAVALDIIGTRMNASIPTTTRPIIIFSLQFLQYISFSSYATLLPNWFALSLYIPHYLGTKWISTIGVKAILGCWESFARSIAHHFSTESKWTYVLSLPLSDPHFVLKRFVLLYNIPHGLFAVSLQYDLDNYLSTSYSVL